MFQLGSKLKDRVSGFIGVAVAKVDYLDGATRYQLQAEVPAGSVKIEDGPYFDEGRLDEVAPN